LGYGSSTILLHDWIFQRLIQISIDYKYYLILHASFCCLFSFAACVYYGPLTNPKHSMIIEYLLKAFSLFFIFFLFNFLAVIIFLGGFLCWFFGDSFFKKKPRRLLTKKQYKKEAIQFTKIELDKLRKFCKSTEKLYELKHLLNDPIRLDFFLYFSNFFLFTYHFYSLDSPNLSSTMKIIYQIRRKMILRCMTRSDGRLGHY